MVSDACAGPIDTTMNTTFYSSRDGTCTGPGSVDGTGCIVAGASQSDAGAKCISLGGDGLPVHVRDFWPPAPDNWWRCHFA